MKRIQMMLIFIFAMLVFANNSNAQQQPKKTEKEQKPCRFTSLSFDVFPVSNTETSEYNPDYRWVCGKHFSGGGLAEVGKKRPFFTNHAFKVKPLPKKLPFFDWLTEAGGTKNGQFLQTGPQVSLQTIPLVKKAVAPFFKYLTVSRQVKLIGSRTPNETLFVWRTQNLKLGRFNLWSEGFQRVRGGNRKDYGQPMALLELPWLKRHLAFAVEVENFGSTKKPNILFGIRIHN